MGVEIAMCEGRGEGGMYEERKWRLSAVIDNRPTEKGLETRNFLAIFHSGARYNHVIYKWR